MITQTNAIHLKDNVFISVGSIPKKARKMIIGSLPFMSDDESKWYVQSIAEKFRNYSNRTGKSNSNFYSAKASLRSAIESIVAKGIDPNKVKFNIYSLN